MNIETTSAAVAMKSTKSTETSSASSSSSSTTKDSSTSFKDELEAAKTQDPNESDATKATEADKNAQKTAEDNAAQQTKKDQSTEDKEKSGENTENTKITDPLAELNSKLATLNDLKNGNNLKTQGLDSKTDDKISDKYSQTIKMDNKDITFFLNLVDNQQMSAQSAQVNNSPLNKSFTDIKNEATHESVQVSATLLNSINESAKTNKPFRIDFGSDVAVIMKVDKEGTISANFIPGSAAVENYLKNNIAGLRQNFDNQNLPYNELSYSKHQRQEQDQQQQGKNKENENE